MVLRRPGPVAGSPLELAELPLPEPAADEVRVRVEACAVCRTDLHVVEGELETRRSPLVPGHEIVGTVEAAGERVRRLRPGDRVGIAWLHRSCGECRFCRSSRENLCETVELTGWTVDGGYAEAAVAPEDFVYPIPDGLSAVEAAPLLCAGIIGYRALRRTGLGAPGGRLGLWGFGAAAHLTIQVARHLGLEVYAFTRDARHRDFAVELGAAWAGEPFDRPPHPLDGGIVFAPAGELVPAALAVLDRGATLVLGGIHMSPIPGFEYRLLWGERAVASVANATRADGAELLRLAAEIPVRTERLELPLERANDALRALRHDGVRGAAVLRMGVAA